MTDPQGAPASFSRIKVRVGALVFCGNDIALIRRDRTDPVLYTPPGGNLETGEDLVAGLRRELSEELGLAPPRAPGRNCCGWSTRWSPGPAPPRPRANCT
ncbi:NUDIX domain-containing protein [Wenjunlia tyrosinilytica]|uniref:NUDIX domain-containing protein n=1 Tax=Wenjunlia tyrosinilytica TaxID=1544741 RepID=UPI001E3BE368|nr:NUDIX hydrolase [Wenjunlia tyrosinilytica]